MRVVFHERGFYADRLYEKGEEIVVPDDFVLPAHMWKVNDDGVAIPTDTGLPQSIPGFHGGR